MPLAHRPRRHCLRVRHVGLMIGLTGACGAPEHRATAPGTWRCDAHASPTIIDLAVSDYESAVLLASGSVVGWGYASAGGAASCDDGSRAPTARILDDGDHVADGDRLFEGSVLCRSASAELRCLAGGDLLEPIVSLRGTPLFVGASHGGGVGRHLVVTSVGVHVVRIASWDRPEIVLSRPWSVPPDLVGALGGVGARALVTADGSVGFCGSLPHDCDELEFIDIGLGPTRAVSGDANEACFVGGDGRVRCWFHCRPAGFTGTGASASHLPWIDAGLTDVVQLSASYSHYCAVSADGTVSCGGRHGGRDWSRWCDAVRAAAGAAAAATAAVPILPHWEGPRTITLPGRALRVSVGAAHACALIANGTVWCWGSNHYGQLGDGTCVDSDAPVLASVLGECLARSPAASGPGPSAPP